jgi:hypothetical protein
LAAVDPLDPPPLSQRSSAVSSRFEEYKVDGEENGKEEEGNGSKEEVVNAADIPAASDGIEVVRIKRKKKKTDGTGKKKDKA